MNNIGGGRKVSLFVHDLASNPIVRAAPVARALQQLDYEVEILGPLLSGKSIYAPFRDAFSYQVLSASTRLPSVLVAAQKLSQRASGDIIYAFKPLWTSLWPALLASGFGQAKPLFFDVEDDELWVDVPTKMGNFVKKHLIRNWLDVSALRYKVLLHPLALICPWGKTVSTTKLQERYGGRILLHGPDGSKFKPGNIELSKNECRRQYGLPIDSLLALFAGSPKSYKGLDTVVQALTHPGLDNVHLVLAGSPDHYLFQKAKSSLQGRCHLLGYIPNDQMPQLLKGVDVVPVIQRQSAFTQAQLPAKLLEAMAMKKTVITSRVGDLPLIVGDDSCSPRGWTVGAENELELANVFKTILSCSREVDSRRNNARRYFDDRLSVDKISTVIEGMMHDAGI